MTIHKPNEFPKKKITNQCNHRSWVAKIESKENRLWKFVQLDVQLFVFPYSIATRKSENLRIFLAQELEGKSKILIKGIFAPRHTSLYPRSIEHFLFVFSYLRSQSRMLGVCYNATGHVGVDQFVWCHRIVVTRATLLWLLPWERNLPFYAYPSFTPPPLSLFLLFSPLRSPSSTHELFQFDTRSASRFANRLESSVSARQPYDFCITRPRGRKKKSIERIIASIYIANRFVYT